MKLSEAYKHFHLPLPEELDEDVHRIQRGFGTLRLNSKPLPNGATRYRTGVKNLLNQAAEENMKIEGILVPPKGKMR